MSSHLSQTSLNNQFPPMSSFQKNSLFTHQNSYLEISNSPKNVLIKLSLINTPLSEDSNIEDNYDQNSSSSFIKFRFFKTDTKDDIKQEIAKAFDVEEFSLMDENYNIITGSWYSLEDNQKYQIIDRTSNFRKSYRSEKRHMMLPKYKKFDSSEKRRDRDDNKKKIEKSTKRPHKIAKYFDNEKSKLKPSKKRVKYLEHINFEDILT